MRAFSILLMFICQVSFASPQANTDLIGKWVGLGDLTYTDVYDGQTETETIEDTSARFILEQVSPTQILMKSSYNELLLDLQGEELSYGGTTVGFYSGGKFHIEVVELYSEPDYSETCTVTVDASFSEKNVVYHDFLSCKEQYQGEFYYYSDILSAKLINYDLNLFPPESLAVKTRRRQ